MNYLTFCEYNIDNSHFRRCCQQKIKNNAHQEDNGKNNTLYNSMEPDAELTTTADSNYSELNTMQMVPYIDSTTNPQRIIEQTTPPSDNLYLEPITLQMTQTSNIPG